MQIIFSDHTIFEMKRRQIDQKEVAHLIRHPGQKTDGKKNRTVIQDAYYDRKYNKQMLLRIIGEESDDTFHVITVYRTSKIEKYWRGNYR
ncbi:MAG: DUF4258 domain-containing protein [Euryarchaeota archaeon]|nr:DUF4258 domain-containing protein [Euryarchaeota archaeon]